MTDPAREALPPGVTDHGPAPGGLRVRSMGDHCWGGRVFVLVDLADRRQLDGRYTDVEAARCAAPIAQGVTVSLASRWRSNEPMRGRGDRKPAKVTEGHLIRVEPDGCAVTLLVTAGHGARSGRMYVLSRGDLLSNWHQVGARWQTGDEVYLPRLGFRANVASIVPTNDSVIVLRHPAGATLTMRASALAAEVEEPHA
jgi:hypothetical protein